MCINGLVAYQKMIRYLVNYFGKYFLSFKNPRVVCPPGNLPSVEGKPIIVASVMRSGTHLAIDLLLNNFQSIPKTPLYVDGDQYFRSEVNRTGYLSEGVKIGKCVLKTHYPQRLPAGKREIFQRLASESHVIVLRRPIEETYRSLSAWGVSIEYPQYLDIVSDFYSFWEEAAPHRIEIDFSQLTNKKRFEDLVRRIESETGIVSRKKIKYPINPKHVGKIALTKFATRLMGKYAPTINTGIRTGMSGA
ncbi:hypothetical protein PVT68_10760 [Microbulbifer bruguierae]|uniref:Sulfotransferase domain-containing protein n=1 Tax=Microbulbifer bruguierae TaxID=3029061 RepID=A0ABY8N8N4_9GAMM|nr:hypothetical protein [Microbulbifer bruguierae]WGL15251.1 hypothetical protein PVT68_10760 [Microbulbifer bruguierae]